MHASIISVKHTNRISISGQSDTVILTFCTPCFTDFSLNPVSHWSLSPPFTSFTTAENVLNEVRFHLSTMLSLLSSLTHRFLNRHSVSDHKRSLPMTGVWRLSKGHLSAHLQEEDIVWHCPVSGFPPLTTDTIPRLFRCPSRRVTKETIPFILQGLWLFKTVSLRFSL